MLNFRTSAVLLAALSVAHAQRCYTVESLQGSYGVVITYGANVALGLQAESLDGRGNLTRTGINNQPVVGSATGDRTIANVISNGTYTVNCNGTGTINRIVTRADGSTATASDDFLITKAVEENGRLMATEIFDAQRDPSVIVPGGIFLTRVHTRRAGNGCYNAESLQGYYGVVVNYGANVAAGLQAETLDGKGGLTRTGPNNQPTAGSTTGARTVSNVTSNGTYTVNCNGTGKINRVVTRADGTTAVASDDFLVVEGVEKDGKLLATRIVDAQQAPSVVVPGGIFLMRTHTYRSPLESATGGPTTPEVKTTAVAGPKDATVFTRTFQLDGSKSTSADGKPLTYAWTIPAGSPQAGLLGTGTSTPTVQFGQGRSTYTFLLTVTDSAGTTATDLVTIQYLGN